MGSVEAGYCGLLQLKDFTVYGQAFAQYRQPMHLA